MIVRITDLNNHAQAVCHHTDVEELLLAPEDEPIGYILAPEHMPIGYTLA